jgi:hypothetical protein
LNLKRLFKTQIPENDALRISLGQELVDAIERQAKQGRDKNGNKFTPPSNKYSDEYADTLPFKAFGKTKGRVNMTLTGSMLNAIRVKSVEPNKITIGFSESDKLQSNKAHGHITGNVGKERDFFGLPDSKVNEIAEKYKDDIEFLKELEEPSQTQGALFITELQRRAEAGEELEGTVLMNELFQIRTRVGQEDEG